MTTDQNPAALKAELRKETRDWLKRGVIPAEAAKTRRMWAEQLPANAYGQTGNPAIEWHLAVAAEWDRIAAKFPEKVRQAYEAKRDYAIACLANQQPGSELAKYWQDDAAKWDRLIGEEL